MSRLGSSLIWLPLLLLAGCWGAEIPDPLPNQEIGEVTSPDDKMRALVEMSDLMREGSVYCGIVANLDLDLKTPTALRFKSIVEKAARDELDFDKRHAELDAEDILSPLSMSTFEGRNASLDTIKNLGDLYNDHAFRGSERAYEAINFFVQMGAVLDFDPVQVLQSDIDGLSTYLEVMVESYGEVVVVCNDGNAQLEGGTLVLRDNAMVQKYTQAVIKAEEDQRKFQSAYQAALGARQRMIDAAMVKAQEFLQPPEEPATQ